MILDILGGPKVITKILIRAGGRRIRVRERERLEAFGGDGNVSILH